MKKQLACLFILGWWALAFWGLSSSIPLQLTVLEGLSPYLNRSDIQKSLLASSIEPKGRKLYPQTFVAADLLFSLVHPTEMIALPDDFRAHTLVPKSLIQQVTNELNPHNPESLCLFPPDVAIVSSYTHPRVRHILKKMNIPTYLMKAATTFDELNEEILNLGTLIGEECRASKLINYIENTIQKIDDTLAKIQRKKVLFVTYNGTMTLPTNRTLIGHMTSRLGINQNLPNTGAWSLPITVEEVISYHPDLIIVSTQGNLPFPQALASYPTLAIDHSLLNTPSHFALLAYYDLACAIKGSL